VGVGSLTVCPDKCIDSTVRGRQGDLMLCDACDLARFPPAFPTTSASTSDNCQDAADTNQVGNSVGDSSAGTPIDNSAVRVNGTLEVNELLCFLSNKLHNYPVSIVKKAALEFYLEGEISAAKQLLLQSVSDKALPIQQFARNRIGSNKNKSNLDDIINIWTIADEHSIIDKLPCFCAANLSRIPVLNDELADIALIKKTV